MALENPPSADDRLQDFFRPGVDPADVVALYPLQQARESLLALMTLFHGTEAAVTIRLLVLREVAARGENPLWLPSELRDRFAYLDAAKLETVLIRLREHGLLLWESEAAAYRLSPVGRMVTASLTTLLKFSDEGAELGYITGQLAAGAAVGRVGAEELQHLLSRLMELREEFERAVLSRSERRIRQAEHRLESVWTWVEKSTEVLSAITEHLDDPQALTVARRIGQVQSGLLSMSSVFQRELNKLEGQRVHLGNTGLSTADIVAWLREQPRQRLLDLLSDGAIGAVPHLSFLLGDIALDVAEWELIDKTRPEKHDVALPPAADSPVAGDLPQEDDTPFLGEWIDQLRTAPDGIAVEDAVPWADYERSSYRFSLLALLGDPESEAVTGPTADLARLPLRWLPDEEGSARVERHGVRDMSAGRLVHREKGK